jgi:hypothetical protein
MNLVRLATGELSFREPQYAITAMAKPSDQSELAKVETDQLLSISEKYELD